MQLSNLEHLPNYTITERLDVVYGSTVRSKHVGKDIFASLKNIVGGELTAYTELLEESREEALQRMIKKAKMLGADAVVGVRFSTSNIAQGASELFVYGTAVKVKPIETSQEDHSNASQALSSQTKQSETFQRFQAYPNNSILGSETATQLNHNSSNQ